MELLVYIVLPVIAVAAIVFGLVKRKIVEPEPGAILDDDAIMSMADSVSEAREGREIRDRNTAGSISQAAEAVHSAFAVLKEGLEEEDAIPAGRWILDNYNFIEQQIHTLRITFSQKLPKLPCLRNRENTPRVAYLAERLSTYTRGKLDDASITSFFTEYQKRMPLKLKEIWMLPVYLRCASIVQIAKVAVSCEDECAQMRAAQNFATFLLENPGQVKLWEKRAAKIDYFKNMGGYFFEQLELKLMEQGENGSGALKWMDTYISQRGHILEDMISSCHRKQSADNLIINNCVDALRYLEALNYMKLFRRISVVERTLRMDPSGLYLRMTQESCSTYRTRIEHLAAKWKFSELHIARAALECAQEYREDTTECTGHIGCYLTGDGIHKLATRLGRAPKETPVSAKLIAYGGSILFFSLLLGIPFGFVSPGNLWIKMAAGILATVIFSNIVVMLVNRTLTAGRISQLLPALELEGQLGESCKTLVAASVLLTNPKQAEAQAAKLERAYLRNRTENAFFSLLGDFPDGKDAFNQTDLEIYNAAHQEIERLNIKYGTRFFLLARKRKYSPKAGVFMAWERKRGALMELCAFLREREGIGFIDFEALPEQLRGINYIMALDADTEIPYQCLSRLAGIMIHPLNKPVVQDGAVRSGYGVIQPRMELSTRALRNTRFSRVYAGSCGLDNYSAAASDLYMDVFNEGIFTGKGMLHVDTWLEVLSGHIPENLVLSHDLLEGSYARCGYASNVVLLDSFPSTVSSYFNRMHRWIRGDIQIHGWLGKKAPDGFPNPINVLSRYKIADNIRRALVFPALWLTLFLNALGGNILPGLLLVLLLCGITLAIRAMGELRYAFGTGFTLWKASLSDEVQKAYAELMMLPWQAWVSMDALIRGFLRTKTRKGCLQWMTAADADHRKVDSPGGYYLHMLPGLLLSTIVLVAGAFFAKGALAYVWAALPIAWWGMPALAFSLSKPIPEQRKALSEQNSEKLRMYARRIYGYFEKFVVAEENYLPPDNYQEHPFRGTASRTSPTNIGFSLVADVAAARFGFISIRQMIERLENTLQTAMALEKWKGHFYNWYDTRTCEPLKPLYVSSVDSGNLMSFLLLCAQALRNMKDSSICSQNMLRALKDAALLYLEKHEDNDLKELIEETIDCDNLLQLQKNLLRLSNWEYVKNGRWGKTLSAQAEELLTELEPFLNYEKLLAVSPDQQHNIDIGTFTNRVYWKEGGAASGGIDSPNGVLLPEELLSAMREDIVERIDLQDAELEELAGQMENLAKEMDMAALYDDTLDLFFIGRDVQHDRMSTSHYDLLASEARQTSLTTIGFGMVPSRHWEKLGRPVGNTGVNAPLLSWDGTMFEYLMPALVTRHEGGTLLGDGIRVAVKEQIRYARKMEKPWGISESAYHEFDLQLNYQYKGFGVPALGMKAGLEKEYVCAPYATFLALPLLGEAAIENIDVLQQVGALGEYGMYDAVDYAPSRRREGETLSVVRNYMVHHQGMSLAALCNLLLDDYLIRTYESIPEIKAAQILYDEKVAPLGAALNRRTYAAIEGYRKKSTELRIKKTFKGDEGEWPPEVHLLSNGFYTLHITPTGAGQSSFGALAVNRWRDDARSQDRGIFAYLHDRDKDSWWSATMQPCLRKPDQYEVVFEPHKASFFRDDGDIQTRMDVIVDSEQPVEVRTYTLSNTSQNKRRLELYVYFEPVLSNQKADMAHLAFQNLFLQSERADKFGGLFFFRRPKSPQEKPIYLFCTMLDDKCAPAIENFDTSRYNCLGRDGSVYDPAFQKKDVLKGTLGGVLDGCICIRSQITLQAGEQQKLHLMLACGNSREEASLAMEKCVSQGSQRLVEMAWTQEQANIKYLSIKPNQFQLFAAITKYIIYSHPITALRASAIAKSREGLSTLWKIGLSGDRPIMVLVVENVQQMDGVKHLLLAHSYFRLKGIETDLVLFNEYGNDYVRPVQDKLLENLAMSHERDWLNKPGGVYVVNAALLEEDVKRALFSHARCVLSASAPFTMQLRPLTTKGVMAPCGLPERIDREDDFLISRDYVKWNNGFGGFNTQGRDYAIALPQGNSTPLPWCNVLTNETFGTIVSESGSVFTWKDNSSENKLTPWLNDPLSGEVSEAIYLRNREDHVFWSPTRNPCHGPGTYYVRHGQGCTTYEYGGFGLFQRVNVFVPPDLPVKVQEISIYNPGPRLREMDVTWFANFLQGNSSQTTKPYYRVYKEAERGLLWAEHFLNGSAGGKIIFMAMPGEQCSFTADSSEFLGVRGSVFNPAGMYAEELSGAVGIGLGGCGVIRAKAKIPPGISRTFTLLMGETETIEEAKTILTQFTDGAKLKEQREKALAYWEHTLSVISIRTPDEKLDNLVNNWLLYQVVAARFDARAGFYQAGGAYGFRDQLQDMLAMVYSMPDKVREHILRCAAHQYEQGDVQHWWHPPAKGVRTHISDDLLYLPLVVADYVTHTGDYALLNETVAYLEDMPIPEGQEDIYYEAQPGPQKGSLYEHCLRAIYHALRLGEHGLPLMGSGDWNDAMNRIGAGGRGESIWLGWFLCYVIKAFTPLCLYMQEGNRATELNTQAEGIAGAIEEYGWDGGWYRRAYFDDGIALGSAQNDECKIDLISQAWAAISGMAEEGRARQALQAVEEHLVNRRQGLVQLLTPPFADGALQPGYIKGYIPGVRENGGQYTHGALWLVMAYLRMGMGTQAYDILELLNPINHSTTQEQAQIYKVEPYVMAADIYSQPPHEGRGGWTWYTGAAAWMYRIVVEEMMGLKIHGQLLFIQPCIPAHWKEYTMEYRYRKSRYIVRVENSHGESTSVQRTIADGVDMKGQGIELTDDGSTHYVHVIMG